jgi:biopolymer transport protein ExbD
MSRLPGVPTVESPFGSRSLPLPRGHYDFRNFMKLSKRKPANIAALNMTPMIDVVFLLLIFFMMVSQVSEVNLQPIELPVLPGGEEQQPATMTINVTQDGAVIVGGLMLNVSDVVSLVGDELLRVGDDPTRLSVVIRADERGESRTVNDLVRALGQMQITRIRLAIRAPDGR